MIFIVYITLRKAACFGVSLFVFTSPDLCDIFIHAFVNLPELLLAFVFEYV